MQNRYAGDIGDYVKLALLRHLSTDRRLGIAWYLFPDENHNADGRHVKYLNDPEHWRHLDPILFDILAKIVAGRRGVANLQKLGAIKPNKAFTLPITTNIAAKDRDASRSEWFNACLKDISDCDIVFADPDNGIIDDRLDRRRQITFGKQMPLSEVKAISEGRTAIIYHHNTRFKGGHDLEVEHWFEKIGANTIAVRANAYSCRTFFIINPDKIIRNRTIDFCKKWSGHKVKLHIS